MDWFSMALEWGLTILGFLSFIFIVAGTVILGGALLIFVFILLLTLITKGITKITGN